MVDRADDLALSDRAEGVIAKAQGWRCTTCGGPLPGGGAVLALATVPETDGPAIPMVIHEACRDDGRRLPRLSDYPDLDDDARTAAAEARAGAIKIAMGAAADTASAQIAAAKRRATEAEQRAVTAEKKAEELQNENQELRDAAYTATARSLAGKP